MPPHNRKPLVLGPRPVDADVTPPPEGYIPPEQAGAPADEKTPPPETRTPPGGDTPPPANGSARNAHNNAHNNGRDPDETSVGDARNDGDVRNHSDEDDEDDEEIVSAYTYASENQVQAARLVVRAFARQRDGVAAKADAARAAIAELQQMGGNRAQVQMVLADARVKPRELGLRADGSPTS